MIRRLSEAAAAFARRYVPDPFVIAVLLTAVTFVACVLGGRGPGEAGEGESMAARAVRLAGVWGGKKGIFAPAFLEFTVQILLVLVTGHALAAAGAVRRLVDRVAEVPRTTAAAAALTALVASLAGFANWGLGLIVGALLARQVGARCRARGLKVHYPLVVAAGYSGLLVWHGGLSGSAPLKVTQATDVLGVVGDRAVLARIGELVAARVPGATGGEIPLSLTLGSGTNLLNSALLLVVVPLAYWLMAPRGADEVQEIDDATAREAAAPAAPDGAATPAAASTPAERLEASRLVAGLLLALGLAHLVARVGQEGLGGVLQALDLNTINLAFLLLGLLLHGSLRAYARAVSDAIPGTAGVVLQFPLYFGIMGLMKESGLVQAISDAMVAASGGSPRLYPVLTFLSAGLVNLFVPSGGGQWAVQGPIVLTGATAVGADPGKAVLALAYGDEWTNMLQPFWALPLLGICGVKARDIMGYTSVACLLAAPVFVLSLWLG